MLTAIIIIMSQVNSYKRILLRRAIVEWLKTGVSKTLDTGSNPVGVIGFLRIRGHARGCGDA